MVPLGRHVLLARPGIGPPEANYPFLTLPIGVQKCIRPMQKFIYSLPYGSVLTSALFYGHQPQPRHLVYVIPIHNVNNNHNSIGHVEDIQADEANCVTQCPPPTIGRNLNFSRIDISSCDWGV